jgi:hypothetical protein
MQRKSAFLASLLAAGYCHIEQVEAGFDRGEAG